MSARNVLITGGAGFIGCHLVWTWRQRRRDDRVLVLDALSYAAHPEDLPEDQVVIQADVCDAEAVARALHDHRIDLVVHLAAESHVDRSIDGPADCVRTNTLGTQVLLERVRERHLAGDWIRMHHVSTDEVYGDLPPDAPPAREDQPYAPSSPYAASKAAADHLVRAWHRTYGLDLTLSSCCNNYGPMQHPEKLIPTVILHALAERPIPLYGDGQQRRDWIWVEDHCEGIIAVATRGQAGRSYHIGADCELSNHELVHAICAELDRQRPRADGSYAELITRVDDRPGHDRRYALDAARIRDELEWKPRTRLQQGLALTVAWYLDNQPWVERVAGGTLPPRRGLER